ncbi:type IV pilus modification protein PilV [Xylella fastidiosa subsp. morus]|uniref:Type IV pilus modification protein PilV n=1 Tax=Xylella fastidiosa subsp. multiplex TaxID=644357 RepID=A0A9Q4MGQ1_XYLFS|nr:type IV pilus modification protein PilV [Xylella fastidiosa]ERI59493.1 prepilin [Xylella fastidiosa subsp. multiplex Griffin-1]ACA11072.1 pre-pilin leader sequence [Xylella fastidiosa M12]AIC13343.1 prepilin [Xylella fastidiosa MUL0034]EWG13687.1 pre-pilin leader sequence [Xylella fastidiosa Mul-MD]KAJ4853872.1 type IV pilus modification protein PilV [Xylella fastidiosa subsp. multiplex]
MSIASKKAVAGVSLIEVLISVFILAVGMLGVAAMQVMALRNNDSALQRSHAVIQSYAILEAMRANRSEAIKGSYNTNGMICTAPQANNLVDVDRRDWISNLKAALGDSEHTCGSIFCDDANTCTIQVQWDETRASDKRSPAGQLVSSTQTQVFEVSSKL